MAELELATEFIELKTSRQRLTMRLRFAGDDQLAGHAPRPRAPSDSLASLQVHQSLLNNVCEKLALEGHTFTLPQLHQHVTAAFHLTNRPVPDSFPEDLSISFAQRDAIRLLCQQGRIELTLAIAKLQKGKRRWRDFVVHVFFKPEGATSRGYFVRDGLVQLSGRPMGTAAQIPLRGIFSKVFPANRRLHVLPAKWEQHPHLAGLEVTQLDVRDGWIGVAIGPRRGESLR
jgi:hypothetical protein